MPKHLLIDVDGVMTTGQFIYSKHGKEYKIFGPHDNDGLKLLAGLIEIAFITADKHGFAISKKRIAEDMGYKLHLVSEQQRFQFIAKTFGFNRLIYIGDGIFDASILKKCMFGIAPHNARREAKAAADYITISNSGEGAVCDACIKIKNMYFRVNVPVKRSKEMNVSI